MALYQDYRTRAPPRALPPVSGPQWINMDKMFPNTTGSLPEEDVSGREVSRSQLGQGKRRKIKIKRRQKGKGPVDWVIRNLPGELHITDQGDDGVVRKDEYCGPELASSMTYAEIASRIANDPSKPAMQRKKAKMVAAIISGKAFLGLGAAAEAYREMAKGPDISPSKSSNSGLFELAGKAISWGLDKIIDKGIKHKNKKQAQKGSMSEINKAISTAKNAGKNEVWQGIPVYKPSGKRKTQKELEDEYYLGIKPQDGAGRRKKRARRGFD